MSMTVHDVWHRAVDVACASVSNLQSFPYSAQMSLPSLKGKSSIPHDASVRDIAAAHILPLTDKEQSKADVMFLKNATCRAASVSSLDKRPAASVCV